MNFIHFLEGAVIAFSLAAPIGPVGILCVRRTLEHGARYGLVIGISAAACDMAYSVVAAFGITLISDFITLEQRWIRLAGGLILLVIGYSAFRPHPLADKAAPAPAPSGHTWAFFSTAILIFTNPLSLFAFAAAFAFIGADKIVGHPFSGLMLVAGVFFGSLTWFVLLLGLVHFFKEKVMRVELTIVNRIAGALLMLCGLYALWNGVSGR
ncbi:MAG: LysE family transporter [Candidatus Sumerlaeota bacterium]|nr:LysE family transporter [Candidatus Sumerlaeota bacterium]